MWAIVSDATVFNFEHGISSGILSRKKFWNRTDKATSLLILAYPKYHAECILPPTPLHTSEVMQGALWVRGVQSVCIDFIQSIHAHTLPFAHPIPSVLVHPDTLPYRIVSVFIIS